MFVGVQRLVLQIPGARSLKDRRHVVRSFKDRVHARFKVSIAEVGDLAHPGRATLGVAVVSNEAAFCDGVLAKVADMASTLPDAVLAGRATEVVTFGRGGGGVRGGLGEPGDGADLEREVDDDPALLGMEDEGPLFEADRSHAGRRRPR
jgi:uncharacterized protein YlxP (DUF503 family)